MNDADTARYYERIFDIVKDETKTVMRGTGLDFNTKISTGEKEIYKVRANVLFSLKQGGFVTYADGKDQQVKFGVTRLQKGLPQRAIKFSNKNLEDNFERIYRS